MLYCERRCRLSDLNFLPSSRQTRWSEVIDFFTATAGFEDSRPISPRPPATCNDVGRQFDDDIAFSIIAAGLHVACPRLVCLAGKTLPRFFATESMVLLGSTLPQTNTHEETHILGSLTCQKSESCRVYSMESTVFLEIRPITDAAECREANRKNVS